MYIYWNYGEEGTITFPPIQGHVVSRDRGHRALTQWTISQSDLLSEISLNSIISSIIGVIVSTMLDLNVSIRSSQTTSSQACFGKCVESHNLGKLSNGLGPT